MKEHCRKLFMIFIYVIMVQFASWMSMPDKRIDTKRHREQKQRETGESAVAWKKDRAEEEKRDVGPPTRLAPPCSKKNYFPVGLLPALCSAP